MANVEECPRETARQRAIVAQEAFNPGSVNDLKAEMIAKQCSPECGGPVEVPRTLWGRELPILPKIVCGLDVESSEQA